MFITFEGVEGCGKSTQIQRVHAWLQAKGQRVLLSREPGGTGIGRTIRGLLLDAANNHLCARTELFLYLADRAQHVQEVIQPALNMGIIVLVDRFVDSTLVYQGFGRGLDLQVLRDLNRLAVQGQYPDLTLLLDVPAEIGLTRARCRNGEQGTSMAEGRFEAESLDFHHRIREGYLHLVASDPDRILRIDATPDEQTVFEAVQREVQSRILLP